MEDLQKLLFHDQFAKRQKWYNLFKDPIWTPVFNVTLKAHRDLAYQQLLRVAKSGIVSVHNFIDDPTNIFTAHEMLGTVAGSTATKFTVHYNLFGGTIMALHTDRHKHIFKKIDSLQITGCFCLTELGFGNNAVQMETTATYDEKTAQFIINCPTVLSQKYWITNGAVHANEALVFAQTIVRGKNEGVSAFLVPIRDKNLKQMQGVEINDMGYKIGLNGIDNAALKFKNLRIPRTNMLNKYSDVDQKGNFTSDIKGVQQRFFKVTERLLSGRLCIASMTIGALKKAIYITLKYSFQRKGVSANGKSETPIFQYQLQKNALIPIVSKMLALNMLHNFAKKTFANPKGHQRDLLMICCVDKTLIGWHTERSITTMRERCGGQGFLAANMFGELLMAAHAAMTAQGDNRVLMIKVVKDYLTIYSKDPSFSYRDNYIKVTKNQQLHNLQILCTLLQMREHHRLQNFIKRMTTLKSQGKTNYEILMFQVSDQIQGLATAYGERLAMQKAIEALHILKESRETVKVHFVLFAWEIVLNQLGQFMLQQWISPKVAKDLKLAYNELIKKAASEIKIVLQSLNVPEHAIREPIAKDYVQYNSYPNYGQVVNAKM